MALPPSTANWHWKNKNVTRWGKEWFERELVTVAIKDDAAGEAQVSSVDDVDGDVELGQRKSRLITIYDCRIKLAWSGTASDGTEVKGSLTIPEVSHEITLDGLSDYVYEWKLDTASSPAVDRLFQFVKAKLPPALEEKFKAFPVAIIDTHGRDLTVSAEPSRTATPAPSSQAAQAVAATAPATAAQPKKVDVKTINTRNVTVSATFQASADDLFGLLTDEKRIPMWTRAPAKSVAQPGTEYSLFGGGVTGKYISLKSPTEIVQTWTLHSPSWPSDHAATMTITLAQSVDSTQVTFSLDGVPVGIEDELKRNIEGYYIHGFKSIGLGSEL